MEQRSSKLPELFRLEDHAFPEKRLGLVHAHRERLRRRQPIALLAGVPALLIQRVARLMDRRAKTLCPIGRVARGHANVRGASAPGEGMGGDVKATILERIAHPPRDVTRKHLLRLRVPPLAILELWVRSINQRVRSFLPVDGIEEWHEPSAKLVKNFVQALRAHSTLERIQRTVVRLVAERWPCDGGNFLFEIKYLLELASKERKVRSLASGRPCLVGFGLELGFFHGHLRTFACLFVESVDRIANVSANSWIFKFVPTAAHAINGLLHIGTGGLVVQNLS
mmetsp:Transcript_44748/g.117354  ORF Transcript_44748/g.117354 Transcript_44748/m.117354 type:complete len:282 (+) Transcript_44748:881-1726(+)